MLSSFNELMFAYAISGRQEFDNYWKGKKIYDVLVQTNLAAKDLRDFKELSESDQRNLVGFCLNLSREFIIHYSGSHRRYLFS